MAIEKSEFDRWWLERRGGFSHGDEHEIAKEAWNEGIRLACEQFREIEGTDYDVGLDLKAGE